MTFLLKKLTYFIEWQNCLKKTPSNRRGAGENGAAGQGQPLSVIRCVAAFPAKTPSGCGDFAAEGANGWGLERAPGRIFCAGARGEYRCVAAFPAAEILQRRVRTVGDWRRYPDAFSAPGRGEDQSDSRKACRRAAILALPASFGCSPSGRNFSCKIGTAGWIPTVRKRSSTGRA